MKRQTYFQILNFLIGFFIAGGIVWLGVIYYLGTVRLWTDHDGGSAVAMIGLIGMIGGCVVNALDAENK